MSVPVEEQVDALMFGAEYGDAEISRVMRRELDARLRAAGKEGRPLRVYAGYDPSSPDIHIGHAITLRKLRQFQDYGHDVTFLIGNFTAQVGDTSDKLTQRPRRTPEEVALAGRTYAEQCFKILSRERTRVQYNADWLAPLTLADVVSLASHFTVQQFLERDNYRNRLKSGDPVGLHEFLYALLQGYDALHLQCDVQLGATEQLFNILAGRKLQEAHGQPGSICITFPILVGTDGVRRMSKSTGNYIGIAEDPSSQFGKAMSISDDTMIKWLPYVTRWTPAEVRQTIADAEGGRTHPMELKKRVAREIVSTYHGDAAAEQAQAQFEQVHQRRERPSDMAEVQVPGPVGIIDFLVERGVAKSRSDARRLIGGRGVRIDDVVVDDQAAVIDRPCLVQVGKRHFFSVQVA